MAFTIYRLGFSDPLQFYEQFGDPVTSTGGAPVPALRGALRHAISQSTLAPTTVEDTVANRLKLRRQWRSLVNNTPMKLTAFYLDWDADPDQNGWYMPDQGQLVDIEGAIGLATGIFKVENAVWILAGRPRTHRRAMWVYLKDLRGGLFPRDYRRVIFSKEYEALPSLSLSFLPPGIADALATGGGVVAAAQPMPAGADGGQCNVAAGLVDLARVSYEQIEASRNQGQVVVYDRRGEQTGPTTGPGAAWEEFYGFDYPYSWLSGSEIDTPVLANERCRVRWDKTGTAPGWRIDVWTGTAWEEQGKVWLIRKGESENVDVTLLSASLVEYGETRAVVQCVMKTSTADLSSREEVFITLQRGWSGPRFEVYPGLASAGLRADTEIAFTLAKVDADASTLTINSGTGASISTAKGTGHNKLFPGSFTTLGTLGENMVMVGRWGAPFGLTIALVQVVGAATQSESIAYGATRNTLLVGQPVAHRGYMSAQFGFPPQNSQQALEAEGMTLGAGTTGGVADTEASAEKTTTAVRTAEAVHVSQATWPNSDLATYRVFAHVKTSESTLKVKAKTAGGAGITQTTTSPTYVWIDLGEISSNGTLEILAWKAAGAGTFSVDRIEAYMTEDRNAASGVYQGGRDLAQACLIDSRMIPTLVARSG